MHTGRSTHFFSSFSHFYFPASGQAVVAGFVPSSPRFLPSMFIAHRVQQSHCSSILHRVLLTHALALSASQFVHKKKSQRFYTSMHSRGLELTKLTYTRLEDNLIRHRGDRSTLLSTSSSYEVSSTNPWMMPWLSVVRQVHEYYAEFCAVNEDFFSANCPETLQLALPRPPAAAKTLFARNREAILSVLLALKKKPSAIRYAVSSAKP